ncbi:hypothetical protein I3843_03G163400 [Carya illinoinensis]|nr:hypothetical protein I3843_03G163400 [Carya illinoinensis]
MNEVLMALLLKLDLVPGVDPSLKDARRKHVEAKMAYKSRVSCFG